MGTTGYVSSVPAPDIAHPSLVAAQDPVTALSLHYNTGVPPYQYASSAVTPSTSITVPAPVQDQKTIYIQNVDYRADWKDIKDLLRSTGSHVYHCKVFEDEDGRSKGRAIATFSTAAEAHKAVRDLNGRKFLSKKLRVTMNEPPQRTESVRTEPVDRTPAATPVRSISSHTGPVIVDGTQAIARRRH